MPNAELYLVLESAQNSPKEDRARLEAALECGPVSTVLLTPGPGLTLAPPNAKALIELIQSKGIAALVADDAELARTLRADGVHLTWSKNQVFRVNEAKEVLGERYIIGADAGRSRHDAMELGEAGVAYVAFGIPPHVEDRETAFARQLDLVSWWSEIFEIPCVAIDVANPAAAGALRTAGADFVAATVAAGLSNTEARSLVLAFQSALSGTQVEA